MTNEPMANDKWANWDLVIGLLGFSDKESANGKER